MMNLKLFSAITIPRSLAVLLLVSVALLSPVRGTSATAVDLYQASVPAPDRSEAALSAAFQSALKLVLVRVTGRRGAAQDPSFSPLFNNARRYMQQYRAGTGNQIWVAFDGPALERWLAQNGQPLWGKERPATLVWVGVPNNKGSGDFLTRDDGSELRRAMEQEAASRGVPLIRPTPSDVQRSGLTYAALVQGPATAFAETGKRLGADGVLVGRAADTRGTSTVRWVFLFQGRSSEFSGSLEGVNRAADVYAGIYAASGESSAVNIEVSGVADLQTYASVQGYLESLTQISRVSVVGFDNDTLRLRLVTRGGIEPLQRVLGQDGRLQPAAGGPAGMPRYRLLK